MTITQEQAEHLLSELKRANDIIQGVISILVDVQSKKLSKTVTEDDLQEYRTIKQAVEHLKSVA